jgi:ATP-dependent helicase/nuclease subunit A
MSARLIPAKTRAAQLAVSDPSVSAWVSANAGSGKTYVLSRRVIRLLLKGEPPARILCLTFTKAAAAHMANEVLKTLREWVVLSDAELDQKLLQLDSAKPTAERRAAARRLFAVALEAPGGLKVQTIHAFCDRILHQFPFEAGVPAGFRVLDEPGEVDLLNRARSSVLLDAARDPQGGLGKALAQVVSIATDKSIAEVFDEVVRARGKLQYLLDPDGLDRIEGEIAAALGLKPGETLSAIEQQIVDGKNLPCSEWSSAATTLQAMAGNPKARGEQLARAAAANDSQISIQLYISVFYTQDGKIRSDGQFGAARLREDEPLLQRLLAERDRLSPLLEKYRAACALDRTLALNALGREIIGRYEAMKRARGALDYNDLIVKTADLLKNQAAAWVQYKLDGGIDHILIDEAQDTSPEQWSVIESLTKEFFAGKGINENRTRTIFAVGDEKQSIFRFQGADPASFEEMRGKFDRGVKAAGQTFKFEKLDLSFRSANGIVSAVDVVFARAEAFKGLSSSPSETRTIHEAIRRDAPAQVEIWDTVAATDDGEDEIAWDAPLDQQSEISPSALLARNIAKAVKHWLSGGISIGDPQSGMSRAPNAGDIIILVRRRGTLFEAILRALKSAQIPVAGADRLQLAEHIAVMDIAALGDALLLQFDDLALACALKSPLFGFDEDELYNLAQNRKGTLFEALIVAAQNDLRMRDVAERLTLWRSEALHLRPFDFLSRVLGRDKGRELFLKRLGSEAADALDELLALALAYEATETPSLQGFLIFLRRGGSQIKRDLEVESAAVRVMTVHGVKGLEAPIVVLADTTSVPGGRYDPSLMAIGGQASIKPLVWALSAKLDCEALQLGREALREKEEEEQRRLLYVALTRTRDALIVCGALSKTQDRSSLPGNCWYRLVRDALEERQDDFVRIEDPGYGFSEKVWRWRFQPIKKNEKTISTPEKKLSEPVWLKQMVAVSRFDVARPDNTFSLLSSPDIAILRSEGRQHGELVHRLLQELPNLDRNNRRARAKEYLAEFASEFSEDIHDSLIRQAFTVLDHPDLKSLFGPLSRAEVSIVGKFGGSIFEDSGRVDRFAVLQDSVWIADFKSDKKIPEHPELAPQNYVEQLSRYRAILQRLFPEKAMRAFLVWTAGPAIQEIPSKTLDEAFRRLTSV